MNNFSQTAFEVNSRGIVATRDPQRQLVSNINYILKQPTALLRSDFRWLLFVLASSEVLGGVLYKISLS